MRIFSQIPNLTIHYLLAELESLLEELPTAYQPYKQLMLHYGLTLIHGNLPQEDAIKDELQVILARPLTIPALDPGDAIHPAILDWVKTLEESNIVGNIKQVASSRKSSKKPPVIQLCYPDTLARLESADSDEQRLQYYADHFGANEVHLGRP